MNQNSNFTHSFKPNRRVLPMVGPEYEPINEKYLSNSPPPPPQFRPKAPKNSPNILVIMLDDMGFGATSAFGGPIPMPAALRLAKKGKKMNRFHTTAVCSPTRASLLTGYNHHSANMGNVSEFCTSYPGNLSTRPKSVTPLARVLKENGFNTAMFGKCHETPSWEMGTSGPFDHWPTNSGFEKFYGFVGPETNQFSPELCDGISQLPTPTDPNYHFSEDISTQCSRWIKSQKSFNPDKPFFAYFSTGATHSPFHVPQGYADKFKGKFDEGWDIIRERTYNNMKNMGVIPSDSKLAPKPEGLPAWDSLDDKQKQICSRQMEVYAGFAYHTDEQVGKIFDTLEELNIFDDTLIFYILGDNGASGEGGPYGSHCEFNAFNGIEETTDYQLENLTDLGTELSYGHYSAGWAVAMDAPFSWMKGVASDFGGTRNGLIASYPNGFLGEGEVCSQFHHVIDIAPTILEFCNIPAPTIVDGVPQKPMEGISMAYALSNPLSADRRKTQYFRVMHHYGIYNEGWMAGVIGKTRWHLSRKDTTMENDPWELYNIEEDYSCAIDLAQKYPDKLNEMKEKFFEQAVKYNALPLDHRGGELFNPKIAGRLSILGDRNELTLYPGMICVREESFPRTKNCSFSIDAEIEVYPNFTDGVIFSIGGRFGGYSLYIKDGYPTFCYNWLGREKTYIKSKNAISDHRNNIKVVFDYDGGGNGKGGLATIFVNNEELASKRIERTISNIICSGETANVGMQRSTPVSDEYTVANSEFKGDIYSVKVKAFRE